MADARTDLLIRPVAFGVFWRVVMRRVVVWPGVVRRGVV